MFRSQGRLIQITCATCGKQWDDFVSNKRKYCSTACSGIARKGTSASDETKAKMRCRTPWNKGKPNPMAESTRLKMLGRVPYNKGKRMSDEQRRKVSIAKNQGKTTEAFRFRMSTAYAEWRTKVFERDHYQCQICFYKGKGLNAHHIFAFAKYPEWRLHLSNGITLCRDCHIQEHMGWPILEAIYKAAQAWMP